MHLEILTWQGDMVVYLLYIENCNFTNTGRSTFFNDHITIFGFSVLGTDGVSWNDGFVFLPNIALSKNKNTLRAVLNEIVVRIMSA